jgi:hypothetical protein
VRDAAPLAATTYWSDPALGDVPVCFLSTADTTGGNSGSPVVDGQGRWIGLNFDRVWENIAGDFGYATERSRNITVDVRYLLWTLDEVAGERKRLQAERRHRRVAAEEADDRELPEGWRPDQRRDRHGGGDCADGEAAGDVDGDRAPGKGLADAPADDA